MIYQWYDLIAAVLLVALLWRGWWWMGREMHWERRRRRIEAERIWRHGTFPDGDEMTLNPGERLVDGEVMYSASWLNDKRHLKAVK